MTEYDEWFDNLYKENAAILFKLAARLLKNQLIAEDLVNEVFLILLCKGHTLMEHPNPGGWLSETMKNLVMDQLKSAQNQLIVEEIQVEDLQIAAPDDGVGKLSFADILPAGLSEKDREILTLFYEMGLQHQDIAEKLNITEVNSRARLFRAKANCKKLMEEEREKENNLNFKAIL